VDKDTMQPSADPSVSSPLQQARALMESGRCVWCESAPATAASYLCRDCVREDPDGLLARSGAVRAQTPSA